MGEAAWREPMRNPLTAALAAMALHALVGLLIGWRYPSVAVFLAGALAIAWATVAPRRTPWVLGSLSGFALLPSLLPLTLLVAAVAALAVRLLPARADPLANLAVALPALTMLTLSLALSSP